MKARRILFVLGDDPPPAELEQALRVLAEHGHHLDLVSIGAPVKGEPAPAERLAREVPGVAASRLRPRDDRWTNLRRTLRLPRVLLRALPTAPLIDDHIASRSPDLVMIAPDPWAEDWRASAARAGARVGTLPQVPSPDLAATVQRLLTDPLPELAPPTTWQRAVQPLLWVLAEGAAVFGEPPSKPARRHDLRLRRWKRTRRRTRKRLRRARRGLLRRLRG